MIFCKLPSLAFRKEDRKLYEQSGCDMLTVYFKSYHELVLRNGYYDSVNECNVQNPQELIAIGDVITCEIYQIFKRLFEQSQIERMFEMIMDVDDPYEILYFLPRIKKAIPEIDWNDDFSTRSRIGVALSNLNYET